MRKNRHLLNYLVRSKCPRQTPSLSGRFFGSLYMKHLPTCLLRECPLDIPAEPFSSDVEFCNRCTVSRRQQNSSPAFLHFPPFLVAALHRKLRYWCQECFAFQLTQLHCADAC